MQTKHFTSDPQHLLQQALKSLRIVQPELTVDLDNKIVYGTLNSSQVAIISGGGAGHEPSFTGLVGGGLLTAAVSGSIFASPSSRQILRAIESIDAPKGLLVTVMQYTGDVLNFAVAVEKARASNPDRKIEMLVVGDDVAVTRSRAGKVGRRGIAGTVLVHKITGALAAAGFELEDIARIGRLIADNVASMGVSLSRIHVPGRPIEDEEALAQDEIELGMGIHNESGCGRRSGGEARLDEVVREMLRQILDSADGERAFLPRNHSEMVLLVNNLGALSVLDLGAVVTEVVEQLQTDWQIEPVRIYAGVFMTSLDGPGFSISLLNLVETGLSLSLLDLLDAPCNARGWQCLQRLPSNNQPPETTKHANSELQDVDKLECDIERIRCCLDSGLQAVIASETEVTDYDNIVGDGDCGVTLKRGAEGIRARVAENSPTELIGLLTCVASAVELAMDGTSGALYAIFTSALLRHAKQKAAYSAEVNAKFWFDALSAAISTLNTYTPAQIGDRTLMDALLPFLEALRMGQSIKAAAAAARHGAFRTKDLRPALGRTVYIGNEDSWLGKVPDPGAWGLSSFLQGLAK